MKTLIAAGMLLALASPAFAETRTCTGRVRIDVADGQGIGIKGEKYFSVGNCAVDGKRVLRTCPLGSYCRVEGIISGDDDIATVTSVTKVRR